MQSVDYLDQFLRRYSCFFALVEISKLSEDLYLKKRVVADIPIDINGIIKKQTVTQWGLAFIAYRLILVSNDQRRKVLNYEDLIVACTRFSNLSEPFINDKDLFGFFGRMIQEQFWWQDINYNFSNFLARHYLLFVELSEKYKSKIGFDFNKTFFEKFQITIKDFIAIGFYIFTRSCTTHAPYFKKEFLTNYKDKDSPNPKNTVILNEILTDSNIEAFLKLSSANYSNIRNISNKINNLILPGYEKYEFNPFFKFPIVEGDYRFPYYRQDCQFVIPNILLLLNKITEGIYWEFRDLYLRESSQDFINSFGELFELYIGELLKRYFGKENIFRVDELNGINFDRNKSDWIVKVDNLVLIFECKSSLLPFRARQTFNANIMKGWIDKVFIKGIRQLIDTEEKIKNDERFKNKEIYKIILTYENLYKAESQIIKGYLETKIKERFKQNISFYTISLSELELLENPIKAFGMSRIIEEKILVDTENKPGAGHDFISVCQKLGEEKLSNSWLDDTFDKYFKETFGLARLEKPA